MAVAGDFAAVVAAPGVCRGNAQRTRGDSLPGGFQLLASAGAAAHVMHTTVTSGGEETQKPQIAAMSMLLKLLHVRERFQPPEPPKRSNPNLVSMMLGQAHPDATVDAVREMLRLHYGIDVRAQYVEQCRSEQETNGANRRSRNSRSPDA